MQVELISILKRSKEIKWSQSLHGVGSEEKFFAGANEDGVLEKPCEGIYRLTHLAVVCAEEVNRKEYERGVVVRVLDRAGVAGLNIYLYL